MGLSVDIGSLIISSPDVRGGRPRIAGTGVTVQRIVGWYTDFDSRFGEDKAEHAVGGVL